MATTTNNTATSQQTTPTLTTHDHGDFHGIVKWFDRKKGFGFITVLSSTDDEHMRKDIFVHHTDISTQTARFKNLFQGEYVSFELTDNVEGENYDYKATNVRGAFGGPLRVDTNVETRPTRPVRGQGRGGPRRFGGGGGGRGRGRGRVIRSGRTSGGGRRREGEERVNLSPTNEEFDVQG